VDSAAIEAPQRGPPFRQVSSSSPSSRCPAASLWEKVPLLDCFVAPCKGGCPISQDIPEYIELCRKGEYGPALKLITEKNALPFITGTICAHRCMNKCTRNFYDESVHIRATKLIAAERGSTAALHGLHPVPVRVPGKKAAIIGGGPTGIAAAYFLGRAGIDLHDL
jgi:putative selenate reductase